MSLELLRDCKIFNIMNIQLRVNCYFPRLLNILIYAFNLDHEVRRLSEASPTIRKMSVNELPWVCVCLGACISAIIR